MSLSVAFSFWFSLFIVVLLFCFYAFYLVTPVARVKHLFSYLRVRFILLEYRWRLLIIFFTLLLLAFFLFGLGTELNQEGVEDGKFYARLLFGVMTFVYLLLLIEISRFVFNEIQTRFKFEKWVSKLLLVLSVTSISIYFHGMVNYEIVNMTLVNSNTFTFFSQISTLIILIISLFLSLLILSALGSVSIWIILTIVAVGHLIDVVLKGKFKSVVSWPYWKHKIIVAGKGWEMVFIFMVASWIILNYLTLNMMEVAEIIQESIKEMVVYTHFVDNAWLCDNPESLNYEIVFLNEKDILVYSPYSEVEFWKTSCRCEN